MRTAVAFSLVWLLLILSAPSPRCVAGENPVRAHKPATAEIRVMRYLSEEVPAWREKNRCFSCHNNGDAARALFAAIRLQHKIPQKALRETTAWLQTPQRWETAGGDEPFKDKKLARLQFTFALSEAVEAGVITDRKPLLRALQALIAEQQPDGAWNVDANSLIGSPVTYGKTLATVLVYRVLERADHRRFAAALRKAERWMLRQKPESVFDSAALLWGLSRLNTPQAKTLAARCRSIILRGQSNDGGWGPYLTSASEPFDTSIVLLALSRQKQEPALVRAIRRGRAFLVAEQLQDGGWVETTRPAARESYAQRISTAGWGLLALLATR